MVNKYHYDVLRWPEIGYEVQELGNDEYWVCRSLSRTPTCAREPEKLFQSFSGLFQTHHQVWMFRQNDWWAHHHCHHHWQQQSKLWWHYLHHQQSKLWYQNVLQLSALFNDELQDELVQMLRMKWSRRFWKLNPSTGVDDEAKTHHCLLSPPCLLVSLNLVRVLLARATYTTPLSSPCSYPCWGASLTNSLLHSRQRRDWESAEER